MLDRSKSSVVMPMYQPLFSSPTRYFRGTRTFSNRISLKLCSSTMFTRGRTLMPGVSMGQMKYDIPLCLGASASVRARKKHQFALWALDDHIFDPFTT